VDLLLCSGHPDSSGVETDPDIRSGREETAMSYIPPGVPGSKVDVADHY
jgi:hypothetical protein